MGDCADAVGLRAGRRAAEDMLGATQRRAPSFSVTAAAAIVLITYWVEGAGALQVGAPVASLGSQGGLGTGWKGHAKRTESHFPHPKLATKLKMSGSESVQDGFLRRVSVKEPFNNRAYQHIQQRSGTRGQFALRAGAREMEATAAGGETSSSVTTVPEMDVDEALEKYAGLGWGTVRQFMLASFMWTIEMMQMMQGVFASPMEYASATHSIVGTFGLGEAATAWIGTCSTLFFSGMTLGVLLCGKFSDIQGRRAAMMVSCALGSFSGFVVAFSPSIAVFALGRFLMGIACGFGVTNAYILATELVVIKHRGTAAALTTWFSTFGMLILAPLGYFVRDWRLLTVVVATTTAIPLMLKNKVFESPRWLIVHGRTEEAADTIGELAKLNGFEKFKGVNLTTPHDDDDRPNVESFFQGMRHPVFSARLVAMVICWFSTGMVYFGLATNIGSVPGNLYVNQAVSALVEIPVVGMQVLLMRWFGRKGATLFAVAAATYGCLAYMIPALRFGDLIPVQVPILIARTFALLGYMILYLYAAELFPTTLRSRAMGTCSIAARIGSMIAPIIIAGSAVSGGTLTYQVFASFLVVSLVLSASIFPETRGIKMPEMLDDLRKKPDVRGFIRRLQSGKNLKPQEGQA